MIDGQESLPNAGRWRDLDQQALYELVYEMSRECAPRDDVTEVADTAFLKIVTAGHGRDRFTNLKAYVRRTVRSGIVALWKERRDQPQSLGSAIERAAKGADENSEKWRRQSRERLERLRDVVASHLPVRQLEMLDFILAGTTTGHELARRMDCSNKDTRRRFRALRLNLMVARAVHGDV